MHSSDSSNHELTDWPFYWLTQAHGRYTAAIEQALSEVEIDVPRWRVLSLLDQRRARSVSELAGEAIIKLSTMTRIVQRMEDEGLVITSASARDARVTEVLLTANGRRAKTLAWQRAENIFQAVFAEMSAGEIESLNDTLRILSDNLIRLVK